MTYKSLFNWVLTYRKKHKVCCHHADQHRHRLISYCVNEATLMSSQIRIKAQRISFANISDDHLGA